MDPDANWNGRCAKTGQRHRATFDDLLAAIESVADQIKVLVSAVDDLRCEVEWQARNASLESAALAAAESERADEPDDGVERNASSPDQSDADDSLLSAAGRLRAYEQCLTKAPRGLWLDEWTNSEELDVLEIPCGRIFSVSPDIWEAMLDVRPAHVIGGEGCDDCEAAVENSWGGPYLLAWRTDREYLIRELVDEEACQLQTLCLECQAETARPAVQQGKDTPLESQLDLF